MFICLCKLRWGQSLKEEEEEATAASKRQDGQSNFKEKENEQKRLLEKRKGILS